MTRAEFVAFYCDEYDCAADDVTGKNLVLRCACKKEGCKGWVLVEAIQYWVRWHWENQGPHGPERDAVLAAIPINATPYIPVSAERYAAIVAGAE